jgi:release factor glutamine methyltransferase
VTPRILSPVTLATARLAAAGVPSPRYDAEVLAAYLLGVDRTRLVSVDRALDATRYDDLIRRRAARVPLQHLTGTAYFRHLTLAVGPGVFVPRPETELLVDLALTGSEPGATVVDLCAGSGAIAIAVATERPDCRVHAVELDPAAAGWLARNVQELAPAVTVHVTAAADVPAGLAGTADVVVSNPPYLPVGSPVDPEVGGHDPAIALWGGPDGLEVLVQVLAAARGWLRPGGRVALEHDVSHQPRLLDLLHDSGFREVAGHRDLAGRERFVTGFLP